MLHYIIDFRQCLGVVLQLVVVPKVEWATVYIYFPRRGAAEEMGPGKEVTGMVHYQVHSFEDHCFITEGVHYRINGHCSFKAT